MTRSNDVANFTDLASAKGDVYVATAADAPSTLPVGADGTVLTADSTTATGLSWQPTSFIGAAGKNKIINGDFAINQRNFTSVAANNAYGFDRWQMQASGPMSITYSSQTFIPGTAPVAGYEGKNFARIVNGTATDVSNASVFAHRIEDVRTFAGQTVTVSFWAKAASGTPSITVELYQYFGTGGSPSADVSGIGAVKQAITTSWARYTATITVPSISGKIIGTNLNSQFQVLFWTSGGSNFNSRNNSLGIQQSNTFDFWGMQIEEGSVATDFQTATGTIQGELAACQRYYYRITPGAVSKVFSNCFTLTTSTAAITGQFPVTMRTAPTALEQSGTAAHYAVVVANTTTACTSVPTYAISTTDTYYAVTLTTGASLTAGRGGYAVTNNSSSYLGWSAEL
jgi:hypothetical protein